MKKNTMKDRTKDIKNQQGYHTLKYSKNYIWFGIVMTLIFLSTQVALLVSTQLNDFDTLGTFIVLFFLCCLTILFSITCKNWGIIFNNEHFIYRTALGREYKFLFSDVIDYKRGTEIIVLKTDKKRLFLDPKLIDVNIFLRLIEKKGNFDKTNLNEIRLTRGNFWVGISCSIFSISMSFLFVIPNNTVDDTVTSWWGYLIIILINFSIFIFTFGSLKWRIFLNEESFTYVTYFGRRHICKYSEVSRKSFTTHFVIIKVKNKYFFIDPNAIGIEKFFRKIN
ncbi:hypothetical protein [Neobacillus sp.]|uniref:hypothetical protein n=1 Tax=Neobacillus sp. TaxID=2675273 RepID=UPI00289AB661|nr:hypothetical protein [Neobacillus sp.]